MVLKHKISFASRSSHQMVGLTKDSIKRVPRNPQMLTYIPYQGYRKDSQNLLTLVRGDLVIAVLRMRLGWQREYRVLFVCLLVCFAQIEMSLFSAKGCKAGLYSAPRTFEWEGSLSCHTCCDTGPRL